MRVSLAFMPLGPSWATVFMSYVLARVPFLAVAVAFLFTALILHFVESFRSFLSFSFAFGFAFAFAFAFALALAFALSVVFTSSSVSPLRPLGGIPGLRTFATLRLGGCFLPAISSHVAIRTAPRAITIESLGLIVSNC